jgi:response regulator RpfG family c-di-GMP phosphodiesterase
MEKQKILIVDDKPENLIALEAVLEDENRELIKAYSGNEALKILLKERFALVLLDVQMPGMDGFEVAQLMHSNQKIAKVPIIFVTAISKEKKYVVKGYEVGAVDYLFKPIEPVILKSKVKFFLELDQQKRELEKMLAKSRQSELEFQNAMRQNSK